MINLETKNWEIKNIDTVLFDKDGTFIDLHYFWGKMTELRAREIIKYFSLDENLFEKLCSFLGYSVQEKIMKPDGITALYSRVKIIEILKNNLQEIGINTTEDELTKIFDSVSDVFYLNINEHTKPIESAIIFIKKLYAKGIKLGIVTSDSIVSTQLTLKHLDLGYLFDVVIGRESSVKTKESGEPTKLALAQLKATPKTTVMIGDAPMDYISAKNAGIDNVILVSTGQIVKDELAKTSNFVVSSLDDIKIIDL